MSGLADERWLTYREVGHLLGVGERAALNWVKEHELPVAPGRPARVLLSAVVAQAEALKRPLAALPNDSEAVPVAPDDRAGTATVNLRKTSEDFGSTAEPLEARYRVTPAEIEQAVARTSAQYMGDLRTMLAEVGKVYERQLAAKDQTIDTQAGALVLQQETIAELRRQRDEDREREREALAELCRRAEAAEAEADALRLRLAKVSVSPVVVVAGPDATGATPTTEMTSTTRRPVQGLWWRVRRIWRGR